MDDIETNLRCMRGGMSWHRNILSIRNILANIERGYRVNVKSITDVTRKEYKLITPDEKESIDIEFELKIIKQTLFAMVYELGMMTTCGLSSGTALSKRKIIISAVDDLDKKDFTALKNRLKTLEEFVP